MNYRCKLLLLFLLIPVFSWAQKGSAELKGVIYDTDSMPIPNTNVYLQDTNIGVSSDLDGEFVIRYEEGLEDTLVISHMGFKARKFALQGINSQEKLEVFLKETAEEIAQVEVKSLYQEDQTLFRIDKKDFELMPVSSGEVESILKKMPGVTSRSELSYQYSVRGGNYDENLIYVNGIEIYRPITIRSGKQEGLSFLNSDMVSSIQFSAGGFESRYGDKMSSVLDIKYQKPTTFQGDLDMSLLGGSVHLQDVADNGKFTYNAGFRYKTNEYLLNSLDVDADYKPRFYDLQTFLTYDLTDELNLNFLGNYNLSRYQFIPQTRETSFGTIQDALSLNIYYEGQEADRFEHYMGALSVNYYPASGLSLKFTGSLFNTLEEERFDILGEYYLNELDKSMSSDTYGDSIMNIGVGGFLEHARNQLDGRIYSFGHKGSWDLGTHFLRWGLKYRYEAILDHINEWKMVDSAGYSIPYSDTEVNLYSSVYADNALYTNRISGYFQDTYRYSGLNGEWYINGGLRITYWDVNPEIMVSPRFSVAFEPSTLRNWKFHFASGYYYQPPFYKEMKRPDGSLNRNIESQKSLHFVLGGEYNFLAWDRPFKYTIDVYYKKLDNLVPYKINNVSVDYLGENRAKGYATGIDMKVNGEFVEGVESWASLSVMKTEENMQGDFYFNEQGKRVEPGYYPRPTDQRFSFSLYFQDYIPNNPTYKMLLSLHYGSRIPFYPPQTERYDQVFRMPPYKRVDIGFSKMITGEKANSQWSGVFKYIRSFWIGVEVFNLLDIDNTISYQWVKTVGNQQGMSGEYAVPNYLTSRRLNLKLTMKF